MEITFVAGEEFILNEHYGFVIERADGKKVRCKGKLVSILYNKIGIVDIVPAEEKLIPVRTKKGFGLTTATSKDELQKQCDHLSWIHNLGKDRYECTHCGFIKPEGHTEMCKCHICYPLGKKAMFNTELGLELSQELEKI